MELSKKIINARKALKKSQEKIAKELGVSLNTYHQYEQGKMKPKNRRLLEKILNLPLGSLEDEQMNVAEQKEYMKNTLHVLMANGEMSQNDLKAFIDEISEMIKDSENNSED